MGLDRATNGSSIRVFSSKIYRILKNLLNLIADFICHASFLLLFLLYECFVKFKEVIENFYWSAKEFRCVPRSGDAAIRSYLQEQGRTFKKRPDHIIIILGPEKPSHEDLAKLISWCEPLGIRYISFYDHKNGIDPTLVFEALKKRSKHIIHRIKWGRSFDEDIKRASIKEINGYRWEGVLRVNILGWDASNLELMEAARELQRRSDGGVVDRAALCRCMERRLLAPPPDMAVVSGPALSYFACTPWHLRLTQFVHIQSHHNMKLSRFLNCLHQYSQCEQRCGK